MVQCKVLKQLSILEQKRSDDEDIMHDVEFLNERLQASVQDLSSFDQYATEVKSGRYVVSLCLLQEYNFAAIVNLGNSQHVVC